MNDGPADGDHAAAGSVAAAAGSAAAGSLAAALGQRPPERDSATLVAVEPSALSESEQVDLLTVLEEQCRWLAAAKLRVVAAIAEADRSDRRLAEESVSLVLQISGRSAQRMLAEASTLRQDLPATMAALAAGRLSAGHAQVVAEGSWRLPDEPGLVADYEQSVLAPIVRDGSTYTVPQFRQVVRRAVLARDPSTAEQRHQAAVADRCVAVTADDDGMAWLTAYLPAPEAQLLHTRLTAGATLLPATDPRTLDQRRADLFVDGMLAGLTPESVPKPRGRRPAIQVTVAADTLLGLDDEPAHLTGYGPITAGAARRLAADESGTWRRLLTDPDTGALLDLSPDRYRPSQRLRDFVSARDDRCAFPTCNQPGYRCEYDHIAPFAAGGPTTRANGALACRRHNQAKAGTGWSYRHTRDGTFVWQTATGHRYRGGGPPWLRRGRPRPRSGSPDDQASQVDGDDAG